MSELYRLVYASKNLLDGSETEMAAAVAQILATSQRNNVKVDVTGALMFNAGAFAQVLEGPRQSVESTFERIQRDMRHADVTVLQCGPVESRGFESWSMAFVGQSAKGQALWSGLAAESGFELARLDGDTVFAMLHNLVLDEENLQHRPVATELAAPLLDVARVRTELQQILPPHDQVKAGAAAQARSESSKAPAKPGPLADREVALAVFKAALADERTITTRLRGELDDLRVETIAQRSEIDALRAERDLWARRARLLAEALGQEAKEPMPSTRPQTSVPKARAA